MQCSHGNESCQMCDRYWWHNAIVKALRESGPYNVWGVASNVGMSRGDVARYVDQLLAWGEVKETEPLWDGLPAEVKWIEAAPNV